jgi:hypothetical protein
MWTEDDVRAVALSLLSEERAERAVKTAQQGWRLVEPSDEAEVAVRIGGPARLTADERWPTNGRGIALTFIAELDLGQLPPHPARWAAPPPLSPNPAPLRVFADLVDNPFDPGQGVVLPLPDAPSRLVEAPQVPEPWPAGGPWDDLDASDRMRTLPASAAAASPFLTIREYDPKKPDSLGDDAWLELAYRVRIERPKGRFEETPWEMSHVFGAPVSTQDDVRFSGTMEHPEVGDPDDWTVLLALHPDRIDVLDLGAYNVVVPTADLLAGRWDRVVVDISSC